MSEVEYTFDKDLIDKIIEEGTENRMLDFAVVVVEDAKQIAEDKKIRDTGRLINSIAYEKTKKDEIFIIVDVPYATIIEYGGKNRPPRPFLFPAIHKNEKMLTREGKD